MLKRIFFATIAVVGIAFLFKFLPTMAGARWEVPQVVFYTGWIVASSLAVIISSARQALRGLRITVENEKTGGILPSYQGRPPHAGDLFFSGFSIHFAILHLALHSRWGVERFLLSTIIFYLGRSFYLSPYGEHASLSRFVSGSKHKKEP